MWVQLMAKRQPDPRDEKPGSHVGVDSQERSQAGSEAGLLGCPLNWVGAKEIVVDMGSWAW
jgi:hypothetical protein